ncbi:MAG: 1-acyl-sn-glycerol-3-phosphate acyltransferase [Myxococcales bacterium]|nr:1-acyl-sn-glycerol-3-phosphate acyltransferase [Myxococcales bacterium]
MGHQETPNPPPQEWSASQEDLRAASDQDILPQAPHSSPKLLVEDPHVFLETPALGEPGSIEQALEKSAQNKLSPPNRDAIQTQQPLEARTEQVDEIDEIERRRLIKSAWTGMQDKLRGFWGWLSRHYTADLTIPKEREEKILEAANQGNIVYVMRSQSYVTYFIYNALLLRYRLPLARFAQGLYWVPWAPFWRNVWIFFTGWIGRLFGSGGKDEAELFRGLLRQQEAAALFLARPHTALTAMRGGFYWLRDKMRALFRLSPAPGGRDVDLVEELVILQRQQKRPIFLCPQILVWDRSPSRSTRSFWDVLFGEKEFPGTLRELYLFFRDRRQSQVRGGDPINIQALMRIHPHWDDKQLAGYLRDRLNRRLDREHHIVTGPRRRSANETKELVLKTALVQKAVQQTAEKEGKKPEEIQRRGKKILDRMASDLDMGIARFLDWILNKIWRQMYAGIVIDRHGIEQLREAALKGPIVLLPSHKSHVDYLIMSQVFYNYDLKIPHITAGDNLLIPIVGWIFRKSGAFFIRRSFGDDEVYKAVFSEYVSLLLRDGNNVEFFIEGGRSRTGKLRQPKMGVLSIVVDSVLENRVPDVYLSPTSIGYDKIIEGESYSNELLGAKKERESIGGLLKARKLLKLNFGHVNIHFAKPISLRRYIQEEINEEKRKRGSFDPFNNREDRKRLVMTLAYRIVYDINMASVATPTALVATVMMTHERRGLSRSELIEKVDWLERAVSERGGKLTPFEDTGKIVDDAVQFLQKLLKRPKGTIEPLIRPRESRRVEMSYYRNQLMHLFLSEGVVACAMQAHPSARAGDPGVPKEILLEHVRKVSQILKFEFVYRPTPDIQDNFEDTLALMSQRGILIEQDGKISAAPQGHQMLRFLRALFTPFLDSYWVSALAMLSFQEGQPQEEKAFLKFTQQLAESLYHEGFLRYSDSVSMDTLSQGLLLLRDQSLLTTEAPPEGKANAKRRQKFLAPSAPYEKLEEFALRLGAYSTCRFESKRIIERIKHQYNTEKETQPNP